MPIALYRIDDRLIHGQVVVGWGQPLNIGFIVLVDDNVACCDWEQDLYRMGVPPEMQIIFADVTSAIRDHASYASDPRRGLLVVPRQRDRGLGVGRAHAAHARARGA